MLSKYLHDNGESFIFDGHYMEIYIPMSYYESKMAVTQGRTIQTFGLLNCSVFNNKMDKLIDCVLNLPTTIYISPNEIEDRTMKMKHSINPEPQKYRVCKFYKGDVVMPSSISRDSTNVEDFVNIILKNKLPEGIPYNKLLDVWEANLELNGIKLGVAASNLEIILAEVCRNINDPNQRFSAVVGVDPKASQYDYRPASIREICSRNSTFAALTFEDMDAMITTSLNMNKYNKKQVNSPIEKIIKM